eukprot:CAMPEP_0198217944 /NCGR_PEP_ID=MMETSP1445-20131203/66593_1 /TAXON_ID=36898 /ORGANISM="Pyramimonas sp., Strain CCMP2087" /LENGTH=49 /DNA_ID=CAMNT_0043894803 /DNA_START=97 /DNA_END=246 /DNA_ORIENTATION=+
MTLGDPGVSSKSRDRKPSKKCISSVRIMSSFKCPMGVKSSGGPSPDELW